MRHFDASSQARSALCIALAACAFACSSDGEHPPVIGAPSGPIISEGGSGMLPGNGGRAGVGGENSTSGGTGNPAGLGSGGTTTTSGGDFGTAGSSNGGSALGTGIAGAAFGTGGGLSSNTGGTSF